MSSDPFTSTEIVRDTYGCTITVWAGTDDLDGQAEVVLLGSPLLTEQSWHDTWAGLQSYSELQR